MLCYLEMVVDHHVHQIITDYVADYVAVIQRLVERTPYSNGHTPGVTGAPAQPGAHDY